MRVQQEAIMIPMTKLSGSKIVSRKLSNKASAGHSVQYSNEKLVSLEPRVGIAVMISTSSSSASIS